MPEWSISRRSENGLWLDENRAYRGKRSIDVAAALLLKQLSDFVEWKYAQEIESDGVGPALIHVRRLGRGLKYFDMAKWRTMGVIECDHQNIVYSSDDERITSTGVELRKGFDESAQWRNVLDGDMHFFGVRPLAKSTVDLHEEMGTPTIFDQWMTLRSEHAPGVFGVNASLGRTDNHEPTGSSVDNYMLRDIDQLTRDDLWQDALLLKGLFETVISGRNH